MLGHDLHKLRRIGLDDVTHGDDRQPLLAEGRHERRLLHRAGDVVVGPRSR